MSNAISLLKANYFRAIMGTASIGTATEAIKLVNGLTTERPTTDVSEHVAVAEATALSAVHILSDGMAGRTASVGGNDWARAIRAIHLWVIAAQPEP